MANPFDLSKFKKVKVENTHTTLRHPQGHEIKIAHASLSSKMKKQLDGLPHYDEGGPATIDPDKAQDVQDSMRKAFNYAKGGHVQNPKLEQSHVVDKESSEQKHEQHPGMADGGMYTGLAPQNRTSGFVQANKRGNRIIAHQVKGYAEGGPILKENYKDSKIHKYADGGSVPKPSPTPNPDEVKGEGAPSDSPETLGQRQQISESFKHVFADGGPAVSGEGPKGEMDPLEAQYAYENYNANEASKGAESVPAQMDKEMNSEAPITPVDASHAHLAEAVKNLSQKYISQGEAAPSSTPSPSPDQAQVPSAAPIQAQDQGTPQGTLPQQAVQNVEQQNKAEMAAAQNTQQAEAAKAGIYGQQAEQMQNLRNKYEEIGNNLHQKFEDLSDKVEAGQIDPHQWWNSKSTGSQILTAIGMMFAGAGAGVSGHPEMAGKAIDAAIERDIDSQKANLQNKQTLLGKYMEMYNNLPQAEAAARLTLNAGVEGLINQNAAKQGSANAINAAIASNAARRQALLPQIEGLAKGQAMMGMYNELNNPGAKGESAGGEEAAYQNEMYRMRKLMPDLGKDMENKYLPGVGVARVPVPDKLREELAARSDLSDKLAKLELFSKQHSGEVLDRATINEGVTLARNAQDAYRRANAQGVFREAEKDFVEKSIKSDPTAFFAKYRSMPGYAETRRLNNDTIKQFYHSYGIRPFQEAQGESAPNQPQEGQSGVSRSGKPIVFKQGQWMYK